MGEVAGDGNLLKGVIWCRQVDNEAESPRYSPVPASFEGLEDSLPRVKTVGDVAINLSDTSDYWDPDPHRRLSFYKNLFLYPSAKGKHMCLGRMFLSTDDRPRLGMKTLVLDTRALFASGHAAAILRRWYYEMASEPIPEVVEGAVSQPLLVELARILSGERLDPENPVVIALARDWPQALDVILTLIERMPQSILALSSTLLFPYFVPAGNVDSSAFSKVFPLSAAIFRMDSGLTPDQRKRRLDAWAKKGVTLVDLTTSPVKEPKRLPAPIQWFTDPKEGVRQERLRSLVDGAELDRLLSGRLDGDDGPYHRRELSRIYTAMAAQAAKDKDLLKPSHKGAAASPPPEYPPVPEELSWPPPWGGPTQSTRVERAGMVVAPTPQAVPRLPPVSHPTAPAPGYVTREDLIHYVDGKIADELTRIFTAGKGPEIERVDQDIEEIRIEVKEMDERLKYFAERTLPLLKKTWAKVDALDKTKSTPVKGRDSAKEIAKLKEEVWEELRRMETDLSERSRHILERMELNLQTQGRIWLTLVQQISRLTEERRATAPLVEERK